ncbi:homocysteine S-methyltransferase family protein [uncultured Lutibacter sp.]|uniref:homocysteine S-methyltransferase family protein n=1 Tax=uncultured Lutibacter sp. TaxID=437739 RepID=UPI00261D6AEC|nr:homocysteine S-methyltransferase family protein [uncultured Lutibacter sp.]
MTFEEIYQSSKIILTEGALVERLKSEFNAEMDDWINHAGFIYTHPESLESLYRQYIKIGQKFDLPIMIMTPTRKVNFESLNSSSFNGKNLFDDSCTFLNRIKKSYNKYSEKILVGGLLGCKGDAYSGEKVLGIKDAYLFHRQQTTQFTEKNIDFLFAGIMPEMNETIGMARAMAETNIPYIISFMLKKDGCLMDGTILSKAIEIIDKEVFPSPICYMTNCIHPTNLIHGIIQEKNRNSQFLERFKGIQSNTSILTPAELNNCNILQQDDLKKIIREMCFLKNEFNFKIFGGCCGTNDKFIKSLTEKITSTVHDNV